MVKEIWLRIPDKNNLDMWLRLCQYIGALTIAFIFIMGLTVLLG